MEGSRTFVDGETGARRLRQRSLQGDLPGVIQRQTSGGVDHPGEIARHGNERVRDVQGRQEVLVEELPASSKTGPVKPTPIRVMIGGGTIRAGLYHGFVGGLLGVTRAPSKALNGRQPPVPR